MKQILFYILVVLAIGAAAMAVVNAIFEHDYWRSVASLVAFVLLSIAFYPIWRRWQR